MDIKRHQNASILMALCYHINMSQRAKLIQRILNHGEVSFLEAANLLSKYGFQESCVGSHHTFRKAQAESITIKKRTPIHKDAVKDLAKIVETNETK